MRRTLLVAAAACSLAVLAGLLILLRPGPSPAGPDPNGAAARPAQLPIAKVILYSSGVGYFQREGKVQGSARIDLSFPAQDINDLLKSLVLRDLNGGHVSAVSYDSQAPVERTLQSFAVNLHGNPSFSAILNQARGERVEVVLQQSQATQPGTITGAILGVEKQHQPAGKDQAVEVEEINLWCAEGMRQVKVQDVQRIRFLNPILDAEVKKALETLALAHDTQKKAVSLSFSGEGEREVRVGYVVEAPVWKTSYRLVLNKEGKPYLQGWAIVENPSDEDWSDVGMALVSGRPISFQMDLYQPLYVPRPVVEPELFASLRPPTYNAAMGGMGGSEHADKGKKASDDGRPAARNRAAGVGNNQEKALGGLQADKPADGNEAMLKRPAETLDLSKGVQSVATASQLGDYFQYVLDRPVSLGRQKSALLPIVNKDVEAERVSIFNAATHPKFPLLGLKFKNATGLHLMQGPITVFEGASYAGDARVLDIQPNEERLISYAVDLGTEVDAVTENPKHTLTKVKVVKGILYSTTRIVDSKTYKAQNRSEQDRTLLVEHPYRPEFTVTSKEQPVETARDVRRFQLKLPAGKGASLTVTEEKDQGAQIALTNSDDNSIRVFIQSQASSPKVQEALKHALELKGKGDQTRQELAQFNQQLADIERDQQRIRANLKETPQTAEAYKKYLAKLDQQETEIDSLRDKIKKQQALELQQRKDYEAFLANLDVE